MSPARVSGVPGPLLWRWTGRGWPSRCLLSACCRPGTGQRIHAPPSDPAALRAPSHPATSPRAAASVRPRPPAPQHTPPAGCSAYPQGGCVHAPPSSQQVQRLTEAQSGDRIGGARLPNCNHSWRWPLSHLL